MTAPQADAAPPRGPDAAAGWLARHEAELVAVRRDLHAHPELGRQEHRTTAVLADRLAAAGLQPRLVDGLTGLWCEIGGGDGPVVVLRADIDALPLDDEKDVPYRSTVPGACHACGHDVHTAVVLGAGLALAAVDAATPLPGRVRLVFQPAEELMPGGAIDLVAAGLVDDASLVLGLHCDPSLPVGQVGLRAGAITSAADGLTVTLTGPGGHTSRPHLTTDLVYVLARVAADLPGALSRLVDPRAGLSLVWGAIGAGVVHNAIPRTGVLKGTVRMLDREAWHLAPDLVRRLVTATVEPFGAVAHVDYARGVPPVVNDPAVTALLTAAVTSVLGVAAAVPTPQSLGGEDFGWYLEKVPGAMARLGVATPGSAVRHDLHQGTFDVDERALGVGVRVLVAAALAALRGELPEL